MLLLMSPLVSDFSQQKCQLLSVCGGVAAIIYFSMCYRKQQRTKQVGYLFVQRQIYYMLTTRSCAFFNVLQRTVVICFGSLFEADVEPMPDVLWPNAKKILCSALSRCTRYIALGLVDALVCVWDRQSGGHFLDTVYYIFYFKSVTVSILYLLYSVYRTSVHNHNNWYGKKLQ